MDQRSIKILRKDVEKRCKRNRKISKKKKITTVEKKKKKAHTGSGILRSIVHKEKRDGGKKPRGLLEVSVGGREKWDRTASTCARNKMNETWAKEMGGVESSSWPGLRDVEKGARLLESHMSYRTCSIQNLVNARNSSQPMPLEVD